MYPNTCDAGTRACTHLYANKRKRKSPVRTLSLSLSSLGDINNHASAVSSKGRTRVCVCVCACDIQKILPERSGEQVPNINVQQQTATATSDRTLVSEHSIRTHVSSQIRFIRFIWANGSVIHINTNIAVPTIKVHISQLKSFSFSSCINIQSTSLLCFNYLRILNMVVR